MIRAARQSCAPSPQADVPPVGSIGHQTQCGRSYGSTPRSRAVRSMPSHATAAVVVVLCGLHAACVSAAGSPAPAPAEQLPELPFPVISWDELLKIAVPCAPQSSAATAVRVSLGVERVAGAAVLTDINRTREILRAGACTGLSIFPFDAVVRHVEVVPHPAETAGMSAWNALDVTYEIWLPYNPGQAPYNVTAQSIILSRRAIAQQQRQRMQQIGWDATMLYLWDDQFMQQVRYRLDDSAASVGHRQQEALILLQVTGRGLLPFTVDKQTLMLASMWRALREELIPFASLNVSDWSPTAAASFYEAGAEDTILVSSWMYMPRVCPLTFQAMFAAAMMNFTAHTTTLGLPMTASFVNATVYTLEMQINKLTGVVTVSYEPAVPAGNSPQQSVGCTGCQQVGRSQLATIVGVSVGAGFAVLLLLAGAAATLAVRRHRRVFGIQACHEPKAKTLAQQAADFRDDPSSEGPSFAELGKPPSRSDSGTPPGTLPDPARPRDRHQDTLWHYVQSIAAQPGAATKPPTGKLGISLHNDSAVGYLGRRGVASGSWSVGCAAKLSVEQPAPLIGAADVSISRRDDGSEWFLGAGTHGKVWKGLLRGTQEVAVRKLEVPSPESRQHLIDAVGALCHVTSSPHVVQVHGACDDDGAGSVSVITEYMEGGDLRRALCADDNGLLRWERTGRRVALDIILGVHELHSIGVAHCDLRSSNVLLASDGTAKIADLGLAALAVYASSAAGSEAAFPYAAPELLMGARGTEKADIFSYGVMLWELATHEMPIRGRLRDVMVPEECPDSVARLIDECLAFDERERPSAADVMRRLQNS